MKLKRTFTLAISIILIIFACKYISTRFYSPQGNKIIPVKIANQIFYAEVVSSDERMQKGLGGRKSMCKSCGMIFEFSKAGKYSFWMKDMQFSLDIIWLKGGRIVHIEKNIQPDFVGTLISRKDADTVLEINAGIVDNLRLEIGDEIEM